MIFFFIKYFKSLCDVGKRKKEQDFMVKRSFPFEIFIMRYDFLRLHWSVGAKFGAFSLIFAGDCIVKWIINNQINLDRVKPS